jgi:3-oxoacyl-(acyl-carrier-protein) synthase
MTTDLRQVVITGMGLVSPSGNDLEEFWEFIVPEARAAWDH